MTNDTVSLPRAFAEELLEYFYTQLPMKQGEIPVQVLRQALQEQAQATPLNQATKAALFETTVQDTN